MSSIDQQFVEFVVKSLVGKPDEVKVVRTIDEKGVLLELTVDPEDLGRVIGKRGATAQSLRTLLRALGTKNEARYNLKIVDNGEPRPERSERPERDEKPAKAEKEEAPKNEPEAVAEVDEVEELIAANSQDDDKDKDDVVSKTRKELEDLDDLDI
jgi:predicted RNA-binding protein YlqC (UPF0109 family)